MRRSARPGLELATGAAGPRDVGDPVLGHHGAGLPPGVPRAPEPILVGAGMSRPYGERRVLESIGEGEGRSRILRWDVDVEDAWVK